MGRIKSKGKNVKGFTYLKYRDLPDLITEDTDLSRKQKYLFLNIANMSLNASMECFATDAGFLTYFKKNLKTSISKPTLYRYLEELERKGFVQKFSHGKSRSFRINFEKFPELENRIERATSNASDSGQSQDKTLPIETYERDTFNIPNSGQSQDKTLPIETYEQHVNKERDTPNASDNSQSQDETLPIETVKNGHNERDTPNASDNSQSQDETLPFSKGKQTSQYFSKGKVRKNSQVSNCPNEGQEDGKKMKHEKRQKEKEKEKGNNGVRSTQGSDALDASREIINFSHKNFWQRLDEMPSAVLLAKKLLRVCPPKEDWKGIQGATMDKASLHLWLDYCVEKPFDFDYKAPGALLNGFLAYKAKHQETQRITPVQTQPEPQEPEDETDPEFDETDPEFLDKLNAQFHADLRAKMNGNSSQNFAKFAFVRYENGRLDCMTEHDPATFQKTWEKAILSGLYAIQHKKYELRFCQRTIREEMTRYLPNFLKEQENTFGYDYHARYSEKIREGHINKILVRFDAQCARYSEFSDKEIGNAFVHELKRLLHTFYEGKSENLTLVHALDALFGQERFRELALTELESERKEKQREKETQRWLSQNRKLLMPLVSQQAV